MNFLAIIWISILFTILPILLAKLAIHGKKRWDTPLPPGPTGIPLLGYLPFLNPFNLAESFCKLSKTYGSIFSLKVGTELAVVLNDFESIKSVFSRAEFNNRPDTFMFRFFSFGEHGVASSSGHNWRTQRNFVHKHLKGLMSKNKIQYVIQEEVQELIEKLDGKVNQKQSVEIGSDINVSVLNIVWSTISGQRASVDNPSFKALIKSVNECIRIASTSGILLFMPWLLNYLPESFFAINVMRQWREKTFAYIDEVIKEHKIYSGDSDFIHAFLKEMSSESRDPSFNETQLKVLCSELFGAGGEPTSVTLKWAMRLLALNPSVTRKVQKEIDESIGRDRFINYDDKSKLPYLRATIQELIRIEDIHPIGVVRSPRQDTEIDGMKIPKGTFVFPNFHAVHRDPQYWGPTPEVITPEHWLNSDGSFTPNHKGFIAFSTGPRNCPGQDLAQMQLFMFLGNLIQRYNFKLPPNDSGRVEGTPGILFSPKPYELILETRN